MKPSHTVIVRLKGDFRTYISLSFTDFLRSENFGLFAGRIQKYPQPQDVKLIQTASSDRVRLDRQALVGRTVETAATSIQFKNPPTC